MAQAAFEFAHSMIPTATATVTAASTSRESAAGQNQDATGFAIGWDHARHRITPPLAHLNSHNPVGQGWTAGRAAFGDRRLRSSATVRWSP